MSIIFLFSANVRVERILYNGGALALRMLCGIPLERLVPAPQGAGARRLSLLNSHVPAPPAALERLRITYQSQRQLISD